MTRPRVTTIQRIPQSSAPWLIRLVFCGGALMAACAPKPTVEPPLWSSEDERIRCTAIDSGMAQRGFEELPLSLPARNFLPPFPPRDVEAGLAVRTIFVVRPNGRVDTSSVAVIGTEDPAYRRAMVQLLWKQRYVAPTVDGCPVRGRGDIMVVAVPVRARMPQ